jgi:hypothetical protein
MGFSSAHITPPPFAAFNIWTRLPAWRMADGGWQ